LNQLDLYDIQWGDHAIEGGPKAILASVNIGTKQFCMAIDLQWVKTSRKAKIIN
jgi:hypothetical protein